MTYCQPQKLNNVHSNLVSEHDIDRNQQNTTNHNPLIIKCGHCKPSIVLYISLEE